MYMLEYLVFIFEDQMGKFGYFKIPGIIVSLVCSQKSDGTHTFDTHSMACFMGIQSG